MSYRVLKVLKADNNNLFRAPTSLKCFSVAFCNTIRYYTMIQYNVSLWRRTYARNVKTLLCVSAVHSHGRTSSPSTPRALSRQRVSPLLLGTRLGSTPTFLYYNLYLNTAYRQHTMFITIQLVSFNAIFCS